MSAPLPILITSAFVLVYFDVPMVEGRPPSVRDCKKTNSKTIDCANMGFLNIPYDVFSIPGKKILLGGNPFVCDCSLVWFLREPAKNKARISDLREMKCDYPHKLKAKSIPTLRERQICGVEPLKIRDICTRVGRDGNLYGCKTRRLTRLPYDTFETKRKINMFAEFICNCNMVWVIRRLKSKKNRDHFLDYKALFCKPFAKSKVMAPVIKFTENDVCPQRAPDPCRALPSPCPKTARCVKTFVGKPFRCEDINECHFGLHGCGENEVCHNKENGYECHCRTGFKRDKGVCIPPDPCKNEKNLCPSTSRCETIRSSSRVSHRCVDIDECLSGDYSCGDKEVCYNKENGYECRCKKQFKRENGICVSTIDPCKKKPPVCNMNTQRCVNGKNFNFYSCEDIDECSTKQHDCDKNAKCINTKPGYKCQCKPGFQRHAKRRQCEDIDECIVGHDCAIYSQCENTLGSYKCSCKKGYHRNGRICKDINECGEKVCPAHSTCENTLGSYLCECLPGYGWEHDRCLDLDECKTNTHTCHQNAECINEIGSYKCRCIQGYEDHNSGRICLKKDKAPEGTTSALLVVAIVVPICLLVVLLVGVGLYLLRKTKQNEETQTKEADLLLQKEKQAAQQTVHMFNPHVTRNANTQDVMAITLASSEEEVDYDYDGDYDDK